MTTSLQPLWRLLQISIWAANMKPLGAPTNKILLRYCLVRPTTMWPRLGTVSLMAWNLLMCYLVRGLVTQVLQMEDIFPSILRPDLCPPANLISLVVYLLRLPRAT